MHRLGLGYTWVNIFPVMVVFMSADIMKNVKRVGQEARRNQLCVANPHAVLADLHSGSMVADICSECQLVQFKTICLEITALQGTVLNKKQITYKQKMIIKSLGTIISSVSLIPRSLSLQVLKQNVRPISFSVETVAASRLSGSVTETRTAPTAATRTPVVREEMHTPHVPSERREPHH